MDEPGSDPIWWEFAVELAALDGAAPLLNALGYPISPAARVWLRDQLLARPAVLGDASVAEILHDLSIVDPRSARSLHALRDKHLRYLDDADVVTWTSLFIRLANTPPDDVRSMPRIAEMVRERFGFVGSDAADRFPITDADQVLLDRPGGGPLTTALLSDLAALHALSQTWSAILAGVDDGEVDALLAWGRGEFERGVFGILHRGAFVRVPPWAVPARG